MAKLMDRAEDRDLVILLRLKGQKLRIDAMKGDKCVDQETVKSSESVDQAAKRMNARMRRDKIVD